MSRNLPDRTDICLPVQLPQVAQILRHLPYHCLPSSPASSPAISPLASSACSKLILGLPFLQLVSHLTSSLDFCFPLPTLHWLLQTPHTQISLHLGITPNVLLSPVRPSLFPVTFPLVSSTTVPSTVISDPPDLCHHFQPLFPPHDSCSPSVPRTFLAPQPLGLLLCLRPSSPSSS